MYVPFSAFRTGMYSVQTSTYMYVPKSMISYNRSRFQMYDIIDPWNHRQYHRFWTMISCMISYTCNLEVQELSEGWHSKSSMTIWMITYALQSPQAPQGTDMGSKWSLCLEAQEWMDGWGGACSGDVAGRWLKRQADGRPGGLGRRADSLVHERQGRRMAVRAPRRANWWTAGRTDGRAGGRTHSLLN